MPVHEPILISEFYIFWQEKSFVEKRKLDARNKDLK
jgi:hypothetical protein